ncbi:DgyrCDS1650 [Dimorphilus gyrociliatus]|uniref:DgyrCDS1650 n=1 Tax=Dimorphilus gyrociliatus TaxID=2664684 RepID=A0A7I8V807_9ANNE|nr:DgyrCDS1650 [Dimorphilus gyrociliatus]
MSICTFDDEKSIPDPVYKNRPGNHIPIVIDNGTFKCRAGYAHDDEPHMVFKSVICRQKGKPDIVGNDIPNVELVRWQLRTPFDRDIVTQYDFEEEILDHIFERLSITSSSVTHPIVMTETICNPNYCRQQMNELLFECYNVPSVSYGIDALYSFFHEQSMVEDALVVSIGYNCCHVIPILDGKMLLNSVRRINVGGAHVDYVMLRLLQLAHPPLATSMSLSRAEYLVRKHAKFVECYNEEIIKWNDPDYYESVVAKYQLPFTAHAQSAINVEEARKKKEVQAERLRQMNVKRRRAKLEEDVQKLNKLITIQELDEEDEDIFLKSLHDLGLASRAELGHEINKLNNSINSVRSKLEEVENGVKPAPAVSQTSKKNLIPEDEVESYVKDLKKQKTELIERREKRRQHRIESAKRRTHASQQRMRILSELAAGQGKKADTFGQRDDDWDVYKEINKDTGHSDSEEEQTKLDEIDNHLREYDPDYSRFD